MMSLLRQALHPARLRPSAALLLLRDTAHAKYPVSETRYGQVLTPVVNGETAGLCSSYI